MQKPVRIMNRKKRRNIEAHLAKHGDLYKYTKEWWDKNKAEGRFPPEFMFDPADVPNGVRYIEQTLAAGEDINIDFFNNQIRAVDNNKSREDALNKSFSAYFGFNEKSMCVTHNKSTGKFDINDGFGRFGGYWSEQIRIAKSLGIKICIPVWVFEFDNAVAKSEFRLFMNRSYTSKPNTNADVESAVHKLVYDNHLVDDKNTIEQSISRHNPLLNQSNITKIYNGVRNKLDSGEDPSKTRPMTTQKIRDLLEENKNTMSSDIGYSSLNGGIKHKNNFQPNSKESVLLYGGSSAPLILDYIYRDSSTIRKGYMSNGTSYTLVLGLSNTSDKRSLDKFRSKIMQGINNFIDTESQWVKHCNGSTKKNKESFTDMISVKFVPQHSSEVVGRLIDGSEIL